MIAMLTLALAPVFFVIGLGYLAGRLKIMDNSHVADLNGFIMQFAVPISLLLGMANLPRAGLIEDAPLAGVFLVTLLLAYGLWYAVARTFGVDRSEAAVQALTVAFPNLAATALPILSGFNGAKGVAEVAVALAMGAVGPTLITLVLLDLGKSGRAGAGPRAILTATRKGLLRPLVWAPVIGALISFSGVTLPAAAVASLKLLSQGAAGGALFLTGLLISAQAIKVSRLAASAVIVTNAVRPLFVLALVKLFGVAPNAGRAAILMAAAPTGFFGILFGVSSGVPIQTTGSMIALSTLSAIVTLAGTIAWLYAR